MGQQVHQKLTEQLTFSQNEVYVNRVKNIGDRIEAVADRKELNYRFFVIENDELNAFTTPGGFIYVHTGLLKEFSSDDELAFVIAHEVAHGAARHVVKKYQAQLGYNIIGNLVLNQLDGGAARIASLGTQTFMNLVFSAYSRQDETEADELAVKYMYLAGYDMQAAIRSLQALQAKSGGDNIPVMLRSHPHLKDRIHAVKKDIQQVSQHNKLP